jgi:fumarate reductase flavoprotein subunit
MEKMKRTNLMMLLVILIALLFLQISCGTIQEYRAEEIPAAVEETVEVEEAFEGPMLLADRHKASGIECSDCHEETPPGSLVPTGVCMTCHEDYREVAASYLDPHNAHISYPDCGDCHHAHRPGEQICQGCHNFNLQAP